MNFGNWGNFQCLYSWINKWCKVYTIQFNGLWNFIHEKTVIIAESNEFQIWKQASQLVHQMMNYPANKWLDVSLWFINVNYFK